MAQNTNPSRTGVAIAAALGGAFLGALWGGATAYLLVLMGLVGSPPPPNEMANWELPEVVWQWLWLGGVFAGSLSGMAVYYWVPD